MSFDLKKLAFDLQLKQHDLSEVMGIAQSQISAMMNGKREIKEEHIERLKDKYGDIISRYITKEKSEICRTDASEDRLLSIIESQQRTIERLSMMLKKEE